MTRKQKRELTWIGKENRHRREARILLEAPARSYHARHRVKDNDLFDNRLILGDHRPARWEWGHDDDSLKVKNRPKAPPPAPKMGQLGLV